MSTTITVSIAGASGYSGNELLKLLVRHRHVRIGGLYAASSAGMRCEELYPALRGRVEATYRSLEEIDGDRADLLFIALPSGHAVDVIGRLDATSTRIIDLGGDLRLADAALYATYYGREHAAPSMLGSVPYGLPEWNRDAIATARVVANPGCYPTSILLPLLPLVRDGLVETDRIVATGISGVTGAGRSSSVALSLGEMHGNLRAYRVGDHQHVPEIATTLGVPVAAVTFVPHLAPIARGIHSTVAVRLRGGATIDDIAGSYRSTYADAPFVRWSTTALPEIGAVVGTNYIDIGARIDRASGDVVLLSAIDNLMKGAAGQAIQNMNIMFGFTETEGLL